MSREVTIPAKTFIEEIRSYKHVYPVGGKSGHIVIVVGVGEEVDGVFECSTSQELTSYVIDGKDYATFLTARPKFNRADLWQAIDILRNRAN